nr:replication factor A protein 1-like [Ipomoea batatas]
MSSSLVVVEALPFYRNAAKFACYAARIEFQTMKGRKSGSRVPNSQFHLPVLRQPGRTLGRVLREHLPPGSPLRRVGRLICHSVRRHLRWVNDNAGPERRGLHVYFDVWVHQRPEKRGRSDSSEVRIASSYDATQLWFNQTFAEFVDFRSKLAANTSPVKSISTTTLLSQSTGPSEFQSGAVIETSKDDEVQSSLPIDTGKRKVVDEEDSESVKKCLTDQFSTSKSTKKMKEVTVKQEKI